MPLRQRRSNGEKPGQAEGLGKRKEKNKKKNLKNTKNFIQYTYTICANKRSPDLK